MELRKGGSFHIEAFPELSRSGTVATTPAAFIPIDATSPPVGGLMSKPIRIERLQKLIEIRCRRNINQYPDVKTQQGIELSLSIMRFSITEKLWNVFSFRVFGLRYSV